MLCVVKFSYYAVCYQKFPMALLKAYGVIKGKIIANVWYFWHCTCWYKFEDICDYSGFMIGYSSELLRTR